MRVWDMLGLIPHPEDIKAALRKRHKSLVKFEKARGLPVGSVRDVLRGRAVTNTARAIADELGMTTDQLFPGRFKSHVRDNKRSGRSSHRLSARAR